MSRRLAYMQQLGIDIYVPRVVLPRARASGLSLRPAVAPQATAAALSPTAAPASNTSDQSLPAARHRPRVELPGVQPTKTPKHRPAEHAPRVSTTAAAVRFQLLHVAFADSVLFISDLKTSPLQPGLEASVMQFLRELMFALGHGSAQASAPAYFQWPLVNKQGVDNGAERAQEVLAGFVQRQLQESRPQHLVLLGEQASRYIQPQGDRLGNSGVKVWRSVPLGKLFADPQSKAGLWRTLQPLIAND